MGQPVRWGAGALAQTTRAGAASEVASQPASSAPSRRKTVLAVAAFAVVGFAIAFTVQITFSDSDSAKTSAANTPSASEPAPETESPAPEGATGQTSDAATREHEEPEPPSSKQAETTRSISEQNGEATPDEGRASTGGGPSVAQAARLPARSSKEGRGSRASKRDRRASERDRASPGDSPEPRETPPPPASSKASARELVKSCEKAYRGAAREPRSACVEKPSRWNQAMP